MLPELLEGIQRNRNESHEAIYGNIASALAITGDDIAAKDPEPESGGDETFAAFCARMKMNQATMTADQFRAAAGLYDATCGKQKVAASIVHAEIVAEEYTNAFYSETIRLARQDALEARGHHFGDGTHMDEVIAEIRSACR